MGVSMPENEPLDEFVCAVYELAAVDGAAGWLQALGDRDSPEDATQRWEAVVAAAEAHIIAGARYEVVAACAAAVVGTADGMWRRHVDQVRARLAISHGGDEVTDEAAVHVARAASDIDAAKLQITTAASQRITGTWPYTQAVARARGAVDRLLSGTRHALDASDPVTDAWRDVHTGCRLAAVLILDQAR